MERKTDSQYIELEQYAENKIIPAEIRAVVLTALSHYPELKDTTIEFVFKKDIKKSFMQAQPKFSTMFLPERSYVINISKGFKLREERISVESMSFDVLVGWIGHELGHIMDYKRRNFFAMLKFGFGYLFSNKYIIGAEREADMHAIEHGLADKIVEVKNFILNHVDVPQVYKNRIRRLYMPPEEVLILVEQMA